MQGFQAKKRLLRASFPFRGIPSILRILPFHTFTAQAQNRSRLRWLEGECVNHYTTPIAAMQCQNAVFKQNV